MVVWFGDRETGAKAEYPDWGGVKCALSNASMENPYMTLAEAIANCVEMAEQGYDLEYIKEELLSIATEPKVRREIERMCKDWQDM